MLAGRTHWPLRLFVVLLAALALAIPATAQSDRASGATQSGSASVTRRFPHNANASTNFTPKRLTQRWTPDAGTGDSEPTAASRAAQRLGLVSSQFDGSRNARVAYAATQTSPTTDVSQALEPIEAMPAPLDTALGHASASPQTSAPHCSSCSSPSSCSSCDTGGWGPAVGSCGCGTTGYDSGIVLIPGVAVDHVSIFGGVQGFTNNSNRGADGSFGFHEGFNIGTAARNIVFPPSVGLQFGMQAIQANLDGASFSLEERNQIFMTAGAFRRGDFGLQGGLVFDYLWDDWYYDLQIGQLRGELSMALTPQTDYGVLFAAPIEDETVDARLTSGTVTETWETLDVYAIFLRSNWLAGGRGEGKLLAGLSGDSDGIIGAQSRLPLLNGFALETDFTYLIPDESEAFGANVNESWNVAIRLAWYPGSLACGQCFRYHRPLFDVANNGSMILRRR